MSDQGNVSVPRALLAEVLNTAMSNSFSTQEEFAYSDEMRAPYEAERDQIRQLLKAAGLPEEDAPGQGFFGLAASLAEQDAKKAK